MKIIALLFAVTFASQVTAKDHLVTIQADTEDTRWSINVDCPLKPEKNATIKSSPDSVKKDRILQVMQEGRKHRCTVLSYKVSSTGNQQVASTL